MSLDLMLRRRYLGEDSEFYHPRLFKNFLFVLHRENTNNMEWGYGFNTVDMLQVTHTTAEIMHLENIDYRSNLIRRGPVAIKLSDRCAPVFQRLDKVFTLTEDDCTWVADQLFELKEAAMKLRKPKVTKERPPSFVALRPYGPKPHVDLGQDIANSVWPLRGNRYPER